VKLLSQYCNRFSAQLCESFNSIKVQFASKPIAWQFSWETRAMCAIMQMNTPDITEGGFVLDDLLPGHKASRGSDRTNEQRAR
jgi:hypothetical protein